MSIKVILGIIAVLVILSFSSVGIAIGLRNYFAASLLFMLGFVFMGYGLRMKKKHL